MFYFLLKHVKLALQTEVNYFCQPLKRCKIDTFFEIDAFYSNLLADSAQIVAFL